MLLLAWIPAGTAVGLLWAHDAARARVDSAGSAALAAARTDALALLSYDYRSIRADVTRATADTTGAFRAQYGRTAATLLSEASSLRAIVQATVGTAAVVQAHAQRVTVLLFVDQASVKQLPGARTPTTRIDQSRVLMGMQRVGGRWLVATLSAL